MIAFLLLIIVCVLLFGASKTKEGLGALAGIACLVIMVLMMMISCTSMFS